MHDFYNKTFYYDDSHQEIDYLAIVKPEPVWAKMIGDEEVLVEKNIMATALFIPTTDCNSVDFTIMIHESVHIALATLRHLKTFPKLDIENTNAEEEKLAYMVQEISYQFLKKMVKKGLW